MMEAKIHFEWSIWNCRLSHLRIIFFFFIHCYLETLQHLGHIASIIFGCIPEVFVSVSMFLYVLLILWLRISWIMVKWMLVMKMQSIISLDDWGKLWTPPVRLVHRCGPGCSMRACHAAGTGSIPGRDRFPGWCFSGFFLSCKTNVGKF